MFALFHRTPAPPATQADLDALSALIDECVSRDPSETSDEFEALVNRFDAMRRRLC